MKIKFSGAQRTIVAVFERFVLNISN